jgi:hypothetical protein
MAVGGIDVEVGDGVVVGSGKDVGVGVEICVCVPDMGAAPGSLSEMPGSVGDTALVLLQAFKISMSASNVK